MKKVTAQDKKPGRLKVKDIMVKRKLITGTPSSSIDSIARMMHKHDVSRIPILNNKKLVGIVTNKDIIEHGPRLIDLLVEQARIKGPLDPLSHSPTSMGQCESCGEASDLRFSGDQFLCERCVGSITKNPFKLASFFGLKRG